MNNILNQETTYEHYFNRQYRVLWHQTLDEHFEYPTLPFKTYNFDVWPCIKPAIYTQKTASGTGITRFEGYMEDLTVFEVWEANALSMRAGFYYELKRMFDNPLNSDEYLIWYPKDKTERAFVIEPIDLIVGTADRMALKAIHDRLIKDFGWLKELVEFSFKIIRNYFPPNFSLEVEDI